ncbi:hypothetical protein K435DRAFT_875127 [Dendrothele bispora CBS 962.96]|uniref:Uncharacterized protein n=1 Tax=Dendrothele bispora (strain CBS 962.96) TaxID=1314807 RepID=A0A4S8KVA9_DENBC|nr:hypothetical protein K435DRAFT_875127 [Dendrothele bispora CBS 962.96]
MMGREFAFRLTSSRSCGNPCHRRKRESQKDKKGTEEIAYEQYLDSNQGVLRGVLHPRKMALPLRRTTVPDEEVAFTSITKRGSVAKVCHMTKYLPFSGERKSYDLFTDSRGQPWIRTRHCLMAQYARDRALTTVPNCP